MDPEPAPDTSATSGGNVAGAQAQGADSPSRRGPSPGAHRLAEAIGEPVDAKRPANAILGWFVVATLGLLALTYVLLGTLLSDFPLVPLLAFVLIIGLVAGRVRSGAFKRSWLTATAVVGVLWFAGTLLTGLGLADLGRLGGGGEMIIPGILALVARRRAPKPGPRHSFDEGSAEDAATISGVVVGLVIGIPFLLWTLWVTYTAFFGGQAFLSPFAFDEGFNLGRGLFWLFIVEPIVLTVAYWFYMLAAGAIGIAIYGIFRAAARGSRASGRIS